MAQKPKLRKIQRPNIMKPIPMRSLPLLVIPAALHATSALPFTEDFETIPADADNVPNVALSSPAPILQWYNHYNNAGSHIGLRAT